jgi:hypothetical protein
MSQALHIFRKDFRYLRLEIAIFLALTALFAVDSSGQIAQALVVMLIIAAIHLTSRAIHAEPIPGTGQFWTTRPYRWQSLMIAKLLMIAVCVVAPIGIARVAKLILLGYPLGASLVPLAWSQLLFFAALLPVAALAALTSGTMEFTIGMLALAVAYLVATFVLPFAIAARTFRFVWPVSVEWLHDSAVFFLLTVIAAIVLFWQYRYRRTSFSRSLTAGGVIVSAAVYLVIPASAGLIIETWLSHGAVPAIQILPDTSRKVTLPPRSTQDLFSGLTRIPVAVAIQNLPDGDEVAVDGLNLSLDWGDGRHWDGPASVTGSESKNGRASIAGAIAVPDRFYSISTPVHIWGSLYFTLFGDAQSRTIPFTNHPTNALDGLQCFNGLNSQSHTKSAFIDYTEDFSSYFCRAFFGWPSRLVYAKAGDLESGFTRLVSYSPFPSGLDLDSSEARYTSLVTARGAIRGGIDKVTIVTRKPMAHLHRDFDFPSVRMSDFLIENPVFTMPRRSR